MLVEWGNMYLDKQCAVYRLQPTALDSDKEQYQAVGNYSSVKINVQPASAELTAVSDGVYGQTFQAYVSVSGIKVGDKLVMAQDSKEYIVKGVNNHWWGPLPHLELILFEGDN